MVDLKVLKTLQQQIDRGDDLVTAVIDPEHALVGAQFAARKQRSLENHANRPVKPGSYRKPAAIALLPICLVKNAPLR